MSHANLAPSAAHRWMRCFASTAMEVGLPDKSSAHAEEGTRAHAYAADLLNGDTEHPADNAEMTSHIAGYASRVNALAMYGAYDLKVETKVSMEEFVPECWGTSDAIIDAEDELLVIDLKYGMGVAVSAENNEQGMLYALGAWIGAGKPERIKRARIIIDQPRISSQPSEWTIKIPDLLSFADRAERAAVMNIHYRDKCKDKSEIPLAEFNPSDKACRWCKAFSMCPAAQAKVREAMAVEYTALPEMAVVVPESVPKVANVNLAKAMDAADYIENWVKAVRAAVYTELHQGRPVAGWKLVQGRQGNRAWSDEAAAEKILVQARLKQDERYQSKLISPTQAEKLLAGNPRLWKKAEALITRSEGGLSVAPESDKRPAYSLAAEYDALPDVAVVAESSAYA